MSGQGSVLASVPVPGGQQQTGVFTLSRPRDFISAMNGGSGRVGPPTGTRPDCSELQGAAASAATSGFRGRHASLDVSGQVLAVPWEVGGGAR